MKVFIFCRYPELGKVKTRIAKESSDEIALALYEKMIAQVFANIKNSTYSFEVHHTGGEAVEVDFWLESMESQKQAEGDLGDKLKHSVKEWFSKTDEALVIIGADQPDIVQAVLAETEEKLKTNDLVVGPAADGGYYLIAMNKAYLELFDNIQWGSASVLQETLSKVLELGLSYFLLAEKSGIDYLSDVPSEWKRELMLHEIND